MPIYEYKCDAGHRWTQQLPMEARDHPLEYPCPFYLWKKSSITRWCRGGVTRVFSFTTPRMVHSHYNPSTGSEVTSMRDFKDQLKKASDAATESTGILHDYQPVDMGEVQKTVTDEGMAATHDHWKKVRGE